MKIGKYFSFTYFIYIAFIILCLFHKAYGESNIEYEEIDYKDTIENNIVNINGNGNETILKILMKQPDEIYNPEEWSKIHEEKINEYLAENNKNNSELKNIRISITYLEHSPYNSTNYQSSIIPTKSNSTITYSEDDEDDSLYFLDFSDMVNKLESEEKQKYDFVVLDNYMLFSEIALIESELMSRFKNRKPTISYLLNLSENIEKLEKEITFNDPRFLEDAKYNGQYYGLPYELDFNVLFYNNTSDNSNYLAKRMSTISWSGLISSLMAIKSNNNKMTIGLTDDIDFLSYFMEFTSDKYNLSDQADPNFFELFYNKTSDKVYKNFRDYLMSCSSNNITSAFQVTLNDAFTSFKEGRSAFIKGKASYYDIFKKRVSSIENEEGGEGVDEGKLNTFDVSLPPKFKSSIIEKYLCINKHSTHDVSLLTKIALQLTSKQMQLYRAEQFGSIPTFDISKRNDDINTNTYCQTHAKICDMIQNMKHVNLKSIFNSKYSAPLIEIIALLPKHFRKCLVQNEINSMPDVFRSINEPLTNVMSIVNALCYILIIVTSAFTGFTMYLINKYKTNPYIKVFTPSILIITMSGIILNIIKIFQYLSPYFELKTRIVISIETLSDNLIYIPMIMIVYGLITILKGELVNSADKTSENFKKIGVIVIVTISSLFIICRLVTIIFSDFYYESNGNIIQSRFPEIVIGSLTFLNLIYKIYIYTVHSILFIMTVFLIKKAKKVKDVNYVFAIFALNISDFLVYNLAKKLSHEYLDILMVFIILLYCFIRAYCIYMLGGSRAFTLLLYYNSSEKEPELDLSSLSIRNFVPLNNKKYVVNNVRRSKSHQQQHHHHSRPSRSRGPNGSVKSSIIVSPTYSVISNNNSIFSNSAVYSNLATTITSNFETNNNEK